MNVIPYYKRITSLGSKGFAIELRPVNTGKKLFLTLFTDDEEGIRTRGGKGDKVRKEWPVFRSVGKVPTNIFSQEEALVKIFEEILKTTGKYPMYATKWDSYIGMENYKKGTSIQEDFDAHGFFSGLTHSVFSGMRAIDADAPYIARKKLGIAGGTQEMSFDTKDTVENVSEITLKNPVIDTVTELSAAEGHSPNKDYIVRRFNEFMNTIKEDDNICIDTRNGNFVIYR